MANGLGWWWDSHKDWGQQGVWWGHRVHLASSHYPGSSHGGPFPAFRWKNHSSRVNKGCVCGVSDVCLSMVYCFVALALWPAFVFCCESGCVSVCCWIPNFIPYFLAQTRVPWSFKKELAFGMAHWELVNSSNMQKWHGQDWHHMNLFSEVEN